MDSAAAKYQKFSSSQNEEIQIQKPKSTSKYCLIIVLLIVGAVAVISIAVAIGVGVHCRTAHSIPTDDKELEETSRLVIITVTQGELEGKYYGSNGGGIHFHTCINDTYVMLTITTTDGELVVSIIHPVVSNMTMMSVNHTDFMIMENQPGRPKYDDYVIPKGFMNMTMSMMMGERNMTGDILQQFDNTTVNETRKSILHGLVVSNEAILIIAAAQALGELGVQGSDYPAAMHFYYFALRLTNAQKDTAEGRQLFSDDDHDNEKQKRQGTVLCSSNGATCPIGSCPYKQGSNNCFGLCGKGCSCWNFVCGNCCVNEYCRSHDQCCEDKGFFSLPCLSAGWRIPSCTEPYSC